MVETVISTAASRFPPAISGAGGAGFAVLWNTGGNTAIRGQMLLGNGARTGAEFAVATAAAGEATFPAAVGDTIEPGFTVAWLTTDPRGIRLRRFEGHGAPVGDEVPVNTSDVDPDFRPAVARLPNRDCVVVWVSPLGVRARIVRNDGTPRGGEIDVSAPGGVHVGPVRIAVQDAGSFVVAWRGAADLATAHVTARLRLFTFDGAPFGAERIGDFIGFNGEMALTGVTTVPGQGGGFAVARSAGNGPGPERMAVVSPFTSDGVQEPDFSLTDSDGHLITHSFAAAPLPLGNFVVTWAERRAPEHGDGTGENVRARLCAALPGQLITVAVAGVGDQTMPCVATTATFDGQVRVGFAWIDDNVSGPAANVRAVRSRVLTDSFAEP